MPNTDASFSKKRRLLEEVGFTYRDNHRLFVNPHLKKMFRTEFVRVSDLPDLELALREQNDDWSVYTAPASR